MDYQEAINYLVNKLPMFSKIGSQAYRSGLGNIEHICDYLDNPQRKFESIHIAGTNGKGSTSHYLSALFQCANYKTGLYTSPHLKNFTERIRLNGIEISQTFVANFVTSHKDFIENCNASFFEITTAMCFQYFAEQKVDIAIIETGLGGRLDCTNIIQPILSLITNISYDHMDILGNTLEKIAYEKAGIIKKNTPVIISERQKEVEDVFIRKSIDENSQLYFTDEIKIINISYKHDATEFDIEVNNEVFLSGVSTEMTGQYQIFNLKGVIKTFLLLRNGKYKLKANHFVKALLDVKKLTNIKGRWQMLEKNPLIICDTGHNESGFKEILTQIENTHYRKLCMILGFVNDKDLNKIFKLLPIDCTYIFSQAKIPRALSVTDLSTFALKFGISALEIPDVNDAVTTAKTLFQTDDLIFVGGSNFLIAELHNL